MRETLETQTMIDLPGLAQLCILVNKNVLKIFQFTFQSCVLSQDYMIYNKRGTERSIQRNKAFESQKVKCK